jgi:acetyl esterase/lipase
MNITFTLKSTYLDLKNHDILGKYYPHICSFVSPQTDIEHMLLAEPTSVWPQQILIDSLNELTVLENKGHISYEKSDLYSVLKYKQVEAGKKVAIVLAGGGYGCVCVLPEDLPISVNLYKKGFNVFSFNYPVREQARKANPVLKEYIKYLHEHADVLGIDMKDYVVIGFSAAGHLAASLGTDNAGITDNPKPILLGLSYPVITMEDVNCETGSRRNLIGADLKKEDIDFYSIEKHVGSDYPNTFIWQCEKDNVVPFVNSLMMVDALKEKGIDYRFEHYDAPVHGWGIAKDTLAEGWIDLFYDYYLSLIK